MVLVDTSVSIEHFRRGLPPLSRLLDAGSVLCHPAVIGELACGTLARRATTLELLRRLPEAVAATDHEARRFLDHHHLSGRGLGWTDVHVLAATTLSHGRLWTTDRRLHATARRLRVAYDTPIAVGRQLSSTMPARTAALSNVTGAPAAARASERQRFPEDATDEGDPLGPPQLPR